MRVSDTNGTNGVQAPTEADLRVQAAGMSSLGGPEATIAEMSLRLEQSADNDRAARRREREMRSAERREALDHERDAAMLQLIGSVASSGLSAAGSAAQMTTGQDGWAQLGKSAGDLTGGVVGYFATDAQIAAKTSNMIADEAQERAQDLSESAQSSEQFAEKALSHLEQIAQARNEAMMTASRV